MEVRCKNPIFTNFALSRSKISEILLLLDITKTRGTDCLAPIFFKQTADQMNEILQKNFKNIKRLRKIPNQEKVASVSPTFKKGLKNQVSNYRPVSLLNKASKVFEKSFV